MKKVMKVVLCIVFLGGLIFLLDFLGICDLSPLLHFKKEEKKMRRYNEKISEAYRIYSENNKNTAE